jgi:transposase-like protein
MSANDQDPSNPYASPGEAQSPAGASAPSSGGSSGSVRCPSCGGDQIKVPSFTWWGGAIGHRIIHHVICRSCGKGFNSRTGQSNTKNIILYQVVIAIILIPIFIWLMMS